jgi:hypothetical protein
MKALAKALLEARREFGSARKDKSNPAFKSKYATLESVMDAIDEPLSRHGVIYWQSIEPGTADAPPSLVLTVMHAESGESVTSSCPLLSDASGRANPMQVLGSAVSYAARYTLLRFFGLSQEDDDAQGAYPPRHQPQPERRPEPAPRQAPAPSGNGGGPRKFSDDVKAATGEGDGFWKAIHHMHSFAMRAGHVAGKVSRPGDKIRELDDAARQHGEVMFAELNAYVGDAGAPN